MSFPRVSVIIPAYRQAEYVGNAIESVLGQSFSSFEIIVVDDASPDNISEVVRQYDDPRVKLINHGENRGLSAARNTGIVASSGEFIALLDADDFFHPAKLEAHVDFLQERADIGVTYNARFELNHSSQAVREIWRPPLTVGLMDLLLGFPFAPSDMVLRREWAFRVGLFDPTMGSAEDTDFPCRLALAGCKFAGIDRALNYRRYHSARGRKNLARRLQDVARAQEAVFADPRCPPEVLSIRDLAIKHHLMVIVSLALIQEETRLGQESVRELIRVDPAVLDGEPCELLSFLVMESVADESLNHEHLLQRIFDQLPPETAWLGTQYDWAVARGYLWRGARAVIWDRPEAGRRHFAQAATLRAEIDEPFIGFLTHHLMNYQNEFGMEPTQTVVQNLSSHLAQVGGRQIARHLKSSYTINCAFQKYWEGEYARVPGMVMKSVANSPSHLLNRGVLSILLRSTGSVVWRPTAGCMVA